MSTNISYSLLKQARAIYTQQQIADYVGRNTKTIRRWEKGQTSCPNMVVAALRNLLNDGVSNYKTNEPSFKFVDLFAGIGGIRLAFEAHGGQCVFTSEWDKFSKKTYMSNFNDNEDNHSFIGDIVDFPANQIPDHDVLLAGFPCQPFSIAGVSKKNSLGKPHGFECDTQGTLFFDVQRIISTKKPKAFLLENVKNLISHDKGNTFKVILHVLQEELGYDVHYKIINGKSFTPQNRERIIIVGFKEKTEFSWDDLVLPNQKYTIDNILHKTDGSEPLLEWDGDRFFDFNKNIVQEKYTLTSNMWTYLQGYAAKHKAAGNGFGYGLVKPGDTTRTLSARYYKDGSEILVWQGDKKRPRRLTPRECARLMGFPDSYIIPVSDTQSYKQFGNSVVMPLIKEVARIMIPHIPKISKSSFNTTQLSLPLFV